MEQAEMLLLMTFGVMVMDWVSTGTGVDDDDASTLEVGRLFSECDDLLEWVRFVFGGGGGGLFMSLDVEGALGGGEGVTFFLFFWCLAST